MGAVHTLSGTIPLGYAGENKAREIAMDISPLTRAWPELTAQLVARRPGESEVYPCATRREGDVLYWLVTGSDTALPGYGEARVQMIGEDGRVAKSAIVQTVIKGGMEGEMRTDPPPAITPWINAMLEQIRETVSGYLAANQGTENAGKLLYIGADGAITPLALGDGLAIRDGVLKITAVITPQTQILFEDAGGGIVTMSGAEFTAQEDGAVLIGEATLTDQGDGVVMIE